MEYKTNVNFRKEKLNQLLDTINRYESEIITALYDDFKKPEFEAVVTETSYVISDLKIQSKTYSNGQNRNGFCLLY